ncbi:uncharacterized protein FIBRA_07709 [Fibroporia radiculosa]|uniref:Uncharacterized protein n=1 Tax=Fibroporia radiculosa TaxID=599839 RepID=J4GFC8_9APHY|nr:uncharacterized protein FIBRA_07709 [Fibroporia radiculosa]CCM05488.1 predicted protein [Fibroporia radiculosa]
MSHSSNPWAPRVSDEERYSEETFLQGALLSNIAYGMQVALFPMCFTALWQKIDRFNYRRQISLLVFVSLIFIIGTLYMGAQAKFTQQAFIEYRDYPGGPSEYELAFFSNPVDEIGNVCFVVGNWFMDAFLVWRFMVIYGSYGRAWVRVLIILPCIMLLASIALGVLLLVKMAGSNPFAQADFALSYYVTTLALNVIVTVMIATRIVLYRRRIRRTFGPHHYSSYSNVPAILIESASLYSLFALLFIVPLGLQSPLANVFMQSVSQVQIVTALMIVFRVATGKAWTEGGEREPIVPTGATAVQLKRTERARAGGGSEGHSSLEFSLPDGLDASQSSGKTTCEHEGSSA